MITQKLKRSARHLRRLQSRHRIRINGITAAGIGLGLSLILWHAMVVQLQQAGKFASQKKALELSNQKLTELATSDELTGLANRRSFDRLIREEFVVLLRETGAAGAREVAENPRSKVAEHPFTVAGEPRRLTASIGIASLDPLAPDALQLAYSRADQAMYAAKTAGRNRVAVGSG